ncbi:ABC-type multidrug transport system, permease component [hydrothermal vent metagenome]|uniref:ABC-type multidrug transport system, permease component n=1 Tax=hydrothermal vent metagenome TaxID=652676 RepID=A0A1W1EFI5_9ZZZZ
MNLFETFKNELKLIFTDAAIVVTIIAGVILYSFLYPQPYAKKNISEIDISVVDYDKSDISRDIIFNLDATAQINVKQHDLSEENAKEALLENKIKAIVIIPKHFKRDLALNKSPTIAIGADGSYFLIYGGVLEGTMKSILTHSAKIKVSNLLKKQVPLAAAKESYAPYAINKINLFNKNNSYTQYVIPAVFILVLHQILLIGLGILGGGINERMREKEDGYFKYAETWKIFLSRTVIFASIFFMHMLFYFGYSFEHFGITRLANIYDLLTFGFMFLLATISFGLFMGSLFSSREIATPIFLFSSLPIIFSAGFIWPIEALPSSIHYISLLIPATSAIHGLLSLNQLGADFSMVIDSYTILCIQAVVYMVLAYFVFSYKRKKYYSK